MTKLTHIGNAPIIGEFEPGSADWHELRKGGIGGSEVAAVLGLSPWSGPHTVWMEKMGLLEDEEATIRMRVGSRLEPLVIDILAERTGLPARPWAVTLRHPDYDWWTLNIDGITYPHHPIEEGDTELRHYVDEVVEAKTTSDRAYGRWLEEGVPLYYQTQCQYILGATGLQSVIVPVLFGNGKFEWWRVERDDEDIQYITEAVGEFWREYVCTGQAPPVDGSSAAREYLVDKYGWAEAGHVVELEADVEKWVEQYEKARRLEKRAEELKAEAQNHLLAAVGTAKAGVTPSGYRITSVRTRRFDERSAFEQFPEVVQEYCTRLDTDALRRHRPDIYETCRTRPTVYPRVSAPKK